MGTSIVRLLGASSGRPRDVILGTGKCPEMLNKVEVGNGNFQQK